LPVPLRQATASNAPPVWRRASGCRTPHTGCQLGDAHARRLLHKDERIPHSWFRIPDSTFL